MSDGRPARDAIRTYYDEFSKTVHGGDLRHRNARIEAAWRTCRRFVPEGARVLEVGCGVGILSDRLARRASRLLGVDISDVNVATAARFVGDGRAAFQVADVTGDVTTLGLGAWDAIVLVDVIEHLPRERRPRALSNLESLLAPRGVVVLTYPTPEFQQHLRAHQPEALQIVDEDVELHELLAETRLRPAWFEVVDVWFRRQYAHLVLTAPETFADVEIPIPLHRRLLDRVRDVAWRWQTRSVRREVERRKR